MKRILLVLLFLVVDTSADLLVEAMSKVDLAPSEIGVGWKRTERADGKASVRHYTRKDEPTWVMVTIRYQGHPERALKEFAERPEIAPNLEKISDFPLSYEQRYLTHKKRYVVIGSFWLEVETLHEEDLRGEVLSAYIKKLTDMVENEEKRQKNARKK